ncbi:MAG: hypothetical protein ACWIPH_09285, partial [Ostreibacterium sp.]
YMPPCIVYGTHRIHESEVIDHAEAYRSLLIGLREGKIHFSDTKKVSKFNLLLSLLIGKSSHD